MELGIAAMVEEGDGRSSQKHMAFVRGRRRRWKNKDMSRCQPGTFRQHDAAGVGDKEVLQAKSDLMKSLDSRLLLRWDFDMAAHAHCWMVGRWHCKVPKGIWSRAAECLLNIDYGDIGLIFWRSQQS